MGKRAYSRAFIVLGIFCFATAPANAGEMYLTPAGVYIDDDKDRGADDGADGGQLSLGWVLSDRVSLEAMAGYADLGGVDDLQIWEGSLNLLYSLSPYTRLSPYLLGGIGMMNSDSDVMDPENSTLANLGVGLMYRFGDSPLSLRLEHRQRFETANTLTYEDQISSLSLQFGFGQSEAPLLPIPPLLDGRAVDADGDGIADFRDIIGRSGVNAGKMYIAPAGVYIDDDKDRGADDGADGGQLSLGWVLSDRVSLEAMAGYADLGGVDDLQIWEGSLNLLYSLSPYTRLSPYLLGGIGMMNSDSDVMDPENSTLANLGVGLMYRFGDSPLSLRLEHRQRFETANTLTYEDQISSLSLQFAFGRSEAPLLPIPPLLAGRAGDADGDGIAYRRDNCPSSHAGARVDVKGCELRDIIWRSGVNAGKMYIAPTGVYIDDDKDRGADDGADGGQLSLGWVLSDRVSLEAMAGYADLGGVDDLQIWEGSLNLLYLLSPYTRLSPYLLGGIGMMNSDSDVMDPENSMLANLGVGLMYRFGDSPLSLRLEHRQRFETANTLTYEDQISSLSLQFAFGRSEAPLPPMLVPPLLDGRAGDADGDGIADSGDNCPSSHAGARVDVKGCELRDIIWRSGVNVGKMYIAPTGVYIDDDKDRGADDGADGGQLSLGWVLSDRVSLEAMVGYADLGGVDDLQIWEGSLNLLYLLSPYTRLSPYLLGGIGMMNSDSDVMDPENSMLANLGVGLMYRFGDSPVSLRLEHRQRFETANTLTYEDQISSLSLQFAFGRSEAPLPPMPVPPLLDGRAGDVDGDGIADSRDNCPNSQAGVRVDVNGCPLDSDVDGVTDGQDRCPNTVNGATVDTTGCELDGDNDRVVDRRDHCPNSQAGARVDVNGCEMHEIIRLSGVQFESNSDRLLPGSDAALQDAVATLRMHPNLIVEVAGHTDSAGTAASNVGLSARRANTVRDYLINGGVNAANLTASGYGEALPIADNASADGRARNRRVELHILSR